MSGFNCRNTAPAHKCNTFVRLDRGVVALSLLLLLFPRHAVSEQYTLSQAFSASAMVTLATPSSSAHSAQKARQSLARVLVKYASVTALSARELRAISVATRESADASRAGEALSSASALGMSFGSDEKVYSGIRDYLMGKCRGLAHIAESLAAQSRAIAGNTATARGAASAALACYSSIALMKPGHPVAVDNVAILMQTRARLCRADPACASLLVQKRLATSASHSAPKPPASGSFCKRGQPDPAAHPLDIVATWVRSDERQRAAVKRYADEDETREYDVDISAEGGEIWFALRSVCEHVSHVRRVFVVTNGQIPAKLNISHPAVHLVTHEEIFGPDLSDALPTFNSFAVEALLYRIPGLSSCFLKMDDDYIVTRPPVAAGTSCNGLLGGFLVDRWFALNLRQPSQTGYELAVTNALSLLRQHRKETFCKDDWLFDGRIACGAHDACLWRAHAHAPIALDRFVLAELRWRFPRESTSNIFSRFRSRKAIEIPFLYAHYVVQCAQDTKFLCLATAGSGSWDAIMLLAVQLRRRAADFLRPLASRNDFSRSFSSACKQYISSMLHKQLLEDAEEVQNPNRIVEDENHILHLKRLCPQISFDVRNAWESVDRANESLQTRRSVFKDAKLLFADEYADLYDMYQLEADRQAAKAALDRARRERPVFLAINEGGAGTREKHDEATVRGCSFVFCEMLYAERRVRHYY